MLRSRFSRGEPDARALAQRFARLRSFAAKNSRTVENDREFLGNGKRRAAQAARRVPPLRSPRSGPQKPFPLAEVPAKPKIARLLPTEPSRQMMPFAALGVGFRFGKWRRETKMCDASGSCSLRISSMAAFTSRIASPSAARAFCRRFGRICSHEHDLAPKVKHRPLDAQTPRLPPTLSRARVGKALV